MNDEWTVSPAAAVAIPGGVRLFNRVRVRRALRCSSSPAGPSADSEATARNLEAAGYHGWKGLALRNAASRSSMPTIAYKSGRRAQIVAQGYRIADERRRPVERPEWRAQG